VGFGLTFLGVISLSSLHWQRWAIQVLPLVVLFAVSAVVTLARVVTRSVRKPEVRRWVLVGIVVAGTVAVAAEPAISLVDDERMQAQPSTRELMRSWITAHVPVGTPIALSEEARAHHRLSRSMSTCRPTAPSATTAYGYHPQSSTLVSLRYRLTRSFRTRVSTSFSASAVTCWSNSETPTTQLVRTSSSITWIPRSSRRAIDRGMSR
jgi:hypothetical protein